MAAIKTWLLLALFLKNHPSQLVYKRYVFIVVSLEVKQREM